MGRDEEGPVTHLKCDLKQIPRVQTENRPAVRGEIPDSTKPFIEPDH